MHLHVDSFSSAAEKKDKDKEDLTNTEVVV